MPRCLCVARDDDDGLPPLRPRTTGGIRRFRGGTAQLAPVTREWGDAVRVLLPGSRAKTGMLPPLWREGGRVSKRPHIARWKRHAAGGQNAAVRIPPPLPPMDPRAAPRATCRQLHAPTPKQHERSGSTLDRRTPRTALRADFPCV